MAHIKGKEERNEERHKREREREKERERVRKTFKRDPCNTSYHN